MRAVYLAAGAAGMYCGSCIRDNLLASTLREQGRDVVLLPLYTPLRTDEPTIAEETVYYGGINVYLQHKHWLFRYTPAWFDRLLDRPALLRRAGRRAAHTRAEELGALTLAVLTESRGALRKEFDRLVAALQQLEPDIVNLPNLMFLGIASDLREALGVPIVCTLGGEDLFLDQLGAWHCERVEAVIRQRAPDADAYIAVSDYYGKRCVDRFGLPDERIHHVPLGVRVQDPEPAQPSANRPFTIGFLGRVCPEKGLRDLCRAVAKLCGEQRECRVRVAGHLPDTEYGYLDECRALLNDDTVFEYAGELDLHDKLEFLSSLDVFSMPSRYPEAKGLPVLEALERGVPVVQPRHGSFPEIIDATGGGLLYAPRKVDELAGALAELMDDEQRRQELGQRGRRAVCEEFSNERMAERTWTIYERCVEKTEART